MEPKTIYIMVTPEFVPIGPTGFSAQNGTIIRELLGEDVEKIGAFIHFLSDTLSQMVGVQTRYDEIPELTTQNGFFYMTDGPERGEYLGFPEKRAD